MRHWSLHDKGIRIFLIALLSMVGICVSSRATASPDAYVELLGQAIDLIESGQYNAAASTIDKALTLEPGEPMGGLALAATLAHCGKVDLAIEEYKRILEADPRNGLAQYGMAVCLLSQGKLDEAEFLFAVAGKSSGRDVGAALAYIGLLRGKPTTTGLFGHAGMFVEATSLQSNGKAEDANKLFLELAIGHPPGYSEVNGAVMTVDKSAPIAFTGESLARLPEMGTWAKKKLSKVSGTVSLKPASDLRAGTKYVSITIDGSIAGMANSRPYQYLWDTTRFTNGIHTVVIAVENGAGETLSDEKRRYWVENPTPGKARTLSGPEADRLMDALWLITDIRPSSKFANYCVGKYYMSRGETQSAVPYMEKAAACDPDYADVRTALRRLYGRNGYNRVSKGPTNGRTIALTFDDGPNASTYDILDILERQGVKATFFLVGSQVEANPRIAKAIVDKGHQVESHTYSHMNLQQLSEREIERELLRSAAAIRDATGKECSMFRAPGGRLSPAGEAAAAKYGFTGVFWTLLCSSFEEKSPEKMTHYVTSAIKDGAIVLMHNGEDVTLGALPGIISQLKAKDYTFVTLRELTGRR